MAEARGRGLPSPPGPARPGPALVLREAAAGTSGGQRYGPGGPGAAGAGGFPHPRRPGLCPLHLPGLCLAGGLPPVPAARFWSEQLGRALRPARRHSWVRQPHVPQPRAPQPHAPQPRCLPAPAGRNKSLLVEVSKVMGDERANIRSLESNPSDVQAHPDGGDSLQQPEG